MSDEKLLTNFPVLSTERLLLRQLIVDDAEDVFEYASVPEVAEFLIWNPHAKINDSLDFIQFAQEQFETVSSLIFGIELKVEKKLIGTIDLRGFNSAHRCGDVGYVISKKYWNKGFVTEAFKEIVRFGFTELNLNRIEAHCEEENAGSWKVMEKVGLIFEGTLREKVFFKDRFHTMKMYSILKKDWLINDKN
jgi:ribosomal-protein-alanine N-acetyltransferase